MLPMGGLELSSSTIQGVIGQGVGFNGTSEWLEIPPPATELTFARDYSISAWVRLSHTPSQSHTSVVGRRFSTGYEDSYDLGIYNTKAYFAYAPGYPPMVSNVTVSPGTWVHMTGVKKGPKATLYVNGVEAVSLEGVPEVIVMDDNHVTIGGQYNYSEVTQHFPGSIDEVRLESVARSAEWILLAYETQKPGATAVVVQ